MLYDYSAEYMFNGNKRKFSAGNALSHGQVEAVVVRNNGFGYITNERFQQPPLVNVPPKLQSFNLSPYLPGDFLGSGKLIAEAAVPALTNECNFNKEIIPGENNITLNLLNICEGEHLFLHVFDVMGRTIALSKPNGAGTFNIPVDRSSEIIFYVIYSDERILGRGKLLIN
jgi:hypothetical protein